MININTRTLKMKDYPNVRSWGISYQEFKNGGWGKSSSAGKLKVANINTLERFIKQGRFQDEVLFNEAAENVISTIMTEAPILRQVKFVNFPTDPTNYWLKVAVYKAIDFMARNDSFWEQINTNTVTTTNFSINRTATNWSMSYDALGQEAKNAIGNSGIRHFKLVSESVLQRKLKSGAVEILGKIDASKISDLKI